jgi:SAM-dependent methyltransferase
VSYVGLDVVRSELDTAPAGSYGEKIATDVTLRVPELEGRFDLIVSWQVLEHVSSVPDALDNFRVYLRPGGIAVISLSGRYSLFGIMNMLIPQRLGVQLVARVMRRDPETVFPTYYDSCYRSALLRHTEAWSAATIVSAWAGALYFHSVRPLQAAYVLYEEWAAESGRDDLATHYFLHLRK